MWNSFIDLLVYVMTQFSGIAGFNTGLIILFTSLLIRFALLPLTVKTACGNLQRQQKLQLIQPELEKLKSKYKNSPEQLNRHTLELFKRHKIAFIDKKGLLSGILQAPLFVGMISAIKKIVGTGEAFLWIRNIAHPDFFLIIIASVLSYIGSVLTPNLSEQSRTIMIWIPVLFTAVFLWKLPAGIGLYLIASNLVNVFQSLIVRHKMSERRVASGVRFSLS